MSTNITLKRSSVQGKVPVVGDLDLGEIAINTYDGKVFIKKNVNGTESIVDITAANSVVLGTDTTGNYVAGVTAGGGITVTGTAGEGWSPTIAHTDTSAQASVNNANGAVIQDVFLDTYGHVTGLGSVDLDSRYYTEFEIQNGSISMRRMLVNPNGAPTANLGFPTVAEMALFDAQFDNKTERHPITSFWIETSTDNVNWTEAVWSDQNKRVLVGGDLSLSGVIIPYGTPYFRIRMRAINYVYLNALYSYFSTSGHTTGVQIFKKHDSGAWTQHTSSNDQVSSWPGHLYLPFSTIPWHPTGTLGTHFHEVYILFTPTWNATYPSNNINIHKLQLWGGYPSGRRNLYSTNEYGDASFPATIGVANGTAAAPAFDFNSDTNTGIYLAANDTLGFATNGTAAAQFTSTGNLRLFNTAGTFYTEFSNQPTANRTITIPDVTGTMATTADVATKVASVTGTAPIVSSGGTTPAISITAATTSAAGSMSAADKTKLDGIEAGANEYSLPAATSTVRGGIELFSNTVQTVAASAVTETASRTYGIQVNADGQAVVNVPWLDGGATNLSVTANTSTVTINSDTGTDATILAANSSTAGIITTDAQTIAGVKTFTENLSLNSIVSLSSEATTLATVTKTQIASFAVASFRSAKLVVQAYNSVTGEVQISELLVAHNGTTASATEYGVVFTGSLSFVTYDVDILSSNVRLMATNTTSNSTQYKISETLMVA